MYIEPLEQRYINFSERRAELIRLASRTVKELVELIILVAVTHAAAKATDSTSLDVLAVGVYVAALAYLVSTIDLIVLYFNKRFGFVHLASVLVLALTLPAAYFANELALGASEALLNTAFARAK